MGAPYCHQLGRVGSVEEVEGNALNPAIRQRPSRLISQTGTVCRQGRATGKMYIVPHGMCWPNCHEASVSASKAYFNSRQHPLPPAKTAAEYLGSSDILSCARPLRGR